MKRTTSVKSKPKFHKKRANAKNPKTPDKPKAEANPQPTPPPPPQDPQAAEKIGGPTPAVRPCGPADTQKGHHDVVQS